MKALESTKRELRGRIHVHDPPPMGSLEARVLVTARKFKERGAIAGEEIEILEPIDTAARAMSRDDGGLFPEEDMPLLKAKSAKSRSASSV